MSRSSSSFSSSSSSSSPEEERGAALVIEPQLLPSISAYLSYTEFRRIQYVCKDWNKGLKVVSSSFLYSLHERLHRVLHEVRPLSINGALESFKDILYQFLTLDTDDLIKSAYTCDIIWKLYSFVYEACRLHGSGDYASILYDYAIEVFDRLVSNVIGFQSSSQVLQTDKNLNSYCAKFCILRFVFGYLDRYYVPHHGGDKETIELAAERIFQKGFGSDQNDLSTLFEDFCIGKGIQNFLFEASTSTNKGNYYIIQKTHAIVEQSPLLRGLLYLSRALGITEGQNCIITLSFSHELLQSACSFCEYFETDPLDPIEKPLRSNIISEIVQPRYYANFLVGKTQEELVELILLANTLEIPGLLDLTCASIACMIKGRSPEEIRQTFNITEPFTSEEEQQVRAENRWVDDL